MKVTILDRKNFPAFIWGFAGIIAIAITDTLTGYEVSFSLFYLMPVCYFTWLFGRGWGMAIAVCCSILWFFSDTLTGHSYSTIWIPYWNAAVRLGFFMIVCFLYNQVYENQKKIKAAYDEVDKLSEVKSEFTWMVSSQLRHPLAAVVDNLHELEKSFANASPDQKKRVELAIRYSSEMLKLVNDVTNFAALQTRKVDLNLEVGDLNRTILMVVQFQKTVADKKYLSLETVLDQSIPKIAFEAESINEALNILISNAIKFSDRGKIIIRSVFQKDSVRISVEDQGVGIDSKNFEHVFKPFEQIIGADGRKPDGAGLGLAMARLIIERHGGKIWIEAKSPAGTIVYFTIPLVYKRSRFN